MGRNLFLRPSPRGGASILGTIFRAGGSQGRSRAKKLPPRKRHGAVGLLRLRLHGEAGRESAEQGRTFSGEAATDFLVIVLVLLLVIDLKRVDYDHEQEHESEQSNTSTHHDASICSLPSPGTAV